VARSLADAGLKVCHIVFDDEGLPGSSDGIQLVTQSRRDPYRQFILAGLAGARALARADARVYIQRSAAFETGVTALFARTRGRRFVFSSSSDGDFTLDSTGTKGPASSSFRFGVRYADEVVVQTRGQQDLAAGRRARPPVLIRSFCVPGEEPPQRREAFLWIGGVIDYKGPLAYLDLAERVPEAQFWMVGTDRGPQHAELAQEVRSRAAALPNVTLLAGRPRSEVMELYPRAVAVVNTSWWEGFPNTFLEGWARGAPALSLNVDPDGVLSDRGLGITAGGSAERLADGARELWAHRAESRQGEARLRDYIAENHAPAVVGREWVDLVRALLSRD
jgi:glycosyltransferase involved in cell wall biosynthesis